MHLRGSGTEAEPTGIKDCAGTAVDGLEPAILYPSSRHYPRTAHAPHAESGGWGIPKEYAIPSLVPVLEVTDGLRSPHVITRIIEKGDKDALTRLRDAVRTDPVVRSEVLALASDLLDHPWAGPEYQEFLDLARTSGHSD